MMGNIGLSFFFHGINYISILLVRDTDLLFLLKSSDKLYMGDFQIYIKFRLTFGVFGKNVSLSSG